jgi:hypothetical protein
MQEGEMEEILTGKRGKGWKRGEEIEGRERDL